MTIYKYYNCMINKSFRVFFNLIVPITLGLASSAINFMFNTNDYYFTFIIFMLLFSINSDFFEVGSIYKKNAFGMQYVKTSFRGNRVIINALFVEMICGMLGILLFYLTSLIYMVDRNKSLAFIPIAFLLTAIFYLLSINITRYFNSFWMIQLIAIILEFIFFCTVSIINISSFYDMTSLVINSVLLIAAFIISYFYASYKLKESYKDK